MNIMKVNVDMLGLLSLLDGGEHHGSLIIHI